MFELGQSILNQINSLAMMALIVTVVVTIIFASAVAKDAGRLSKRHHSTWLTSGIVWAFATLVGGVWVVAVYWLVHYSSLSKGR